jgi:phosphoribosylglycinamide formyltransferase-1
MVNLAILGSYNGSGFDAIYEAMQDKVLNIDIPLVISNNTDAVILQKAKTRDISNFVINDKVCKNSDDCIVELLEKYNCKYIFLSGYMKKISSKILSCATVINCHPALLPSQYGGVGMYGSFVHKAVIKNKEKISGVTIHYVDEIYDNGEIILKNTLKIKEGATPQWLEDNIKKLEKKTIVQGLKICLR